MLYFGFGIRQGNVCYFSFIYAHPLKCVYQFYLFCLCVLDAIMQLVISISYFHKISRVITIVNAYYKREQIVLFTKKTLLKIDHFIDKNGDISVTEKI